MYIFYVYSITMDIKTTRRFPEKTNSSAIERVSVFRNQHQHVNNLVCKYWLAGKCTRNPYRFLHTESPSPYSKQSSLVYEDKRTKSTWRNPKYTKKPTVCKNAQESQKVVSKSEGVGSGGKSVGKTQQKMCKFWVTGNCVQGDKCKDLHSWFCGDGFSMLAKLEGHNKAVTGIGLPSGSDKLYSGSKDKSLRVWDCNTGQCAGVVNFDCESGTLISEGPWLFLGLPNAIKAWNIQTRAELSLAGPAGLVYAMVVGNDMLFAGTEDGTILAWKSSSETSCLELCTSLKGHSSAVISLTVGANWLYSGSMDYTIRVWDLETLQCVHTLNGHTNDVTSLVCWDSYLLSGSLDNTIKAWAATPSGNLEVVYEHNEEHGVLALCGIHDSEAKPILLCSCKDNAVRLYELPSFNARGRIFAKQEVRAIQIGPAGLFFTGDATGQLFVWKLNGEANAAVS